MDGDIQKLLIHPMSFEELIRSLESSIDYDNLYYYINNTLLFEPNKSSLVIEDRHIGLTKKETKLLMVLLQNRHRIVSYVEIENYVWPNESMSRNSLTSIVRNIRKKAELDNLNINDFIFDDSKSLFTPEELEYLKANPVIKLASDRNWAPLEFEDPKSGFSGISADYFKLFEKKLGVQFQPVYLDSWDNVLKEAKRGELDVFSCAVETPERSQYMRFTEPYLSFPMALASKDMISFADKYSQLEGYTIAVVKGYWTEELMATQYPGVKLLKVDGVN